MKKRDDYSAPNLNDQLLKEFNKKKILKNLNDKFSSDHASKPASELHEDRMVMPRDDEGIFSHAKQQDVNDDFINELVNEKEGVPGGNFVQANWNVGGSHLRETTHIPICDDPEGKITGFENDYDDPKYRVHGGRAQQPWAPSGRMPWRNQSIAMAMAVTQPTSRMMIARAMIRRRWQITARGNLSSTRAWRTMKTTSPMMMTQVAWTRRRNRGGCRTSLAMETAHQAMRRMIALRLLNRRYLRAHSIRRRSAISRGSSKPYRNESMS